MKWQRKLGCAIRLDGGAGLEATIKYVTDGMPVQVEHAFHSDGCIAPETMTHHQETDR